MPCNILAISSASPSIASGYVVSVMAQLNCHTAYDLAGIYQSVLGLPDGIY